MMQEWAAPTVRDIADILDSDSCLRGCDTELMADMILNQRRDAATVAYAFLKAGKCY